MPSVEIAGNRREANRNGTARNSANDFADVRACVCIRVCALLAAC